MYTDKTKQGAIKSRMLEIDSVDDGKVLIRREAPGMSS